MIAVKAVRITPTVPLLKPKEVNKTFVNKKENTEIRAVAMGLDDSLPFSATKAPPMTKIKTRII